MTDPAGLGEGTGDCWPGTRSRSAVGRRRKCYRLRQLMNLNPTGTSAVGGPGRRRPSGRRTALGRRQARARTASRPHHPGRMIPGDFRATTMTITGQR